MAERRMFAKSIVLSDAFLDLPMSARCLYFTLSMFADDDGFVGSPRAIMRQCGAAYDDLSVLLQKRFILGFDSGVIVIKHWRINNYLQADRKKETTYIEELATLTTDAKNAYIEKPAENPEPMYTKCIQDVYTGKCSVDKYSIDKSSRGKCDDGGESAVENSENVENSVENTLKPVRGIGQGVVKLTPDQFEKLVEKMGLDNFNDYVDRLASFIVDKGAVVHNHYQTILKWYREDSNA